MKSPFRVERCAAAVRAHGALNSPDLAGPRLLRFEPDRARDAGGRARLTRRAPALPGRPRRPHVRGPMTSRALPALAAALLSASAAQAGEPHLAFDVRADFVRHDPTYVADRRAARAPLAILTAGVRALEAAGDPRTRCAQERLTELRVTTHDTDDFALARTEAAALNRLLAAPGADTAPDGPDAQGAWGRCYARWYLRLDASYDVISERSGPLDLPARFLDRVNGPEALEAYLRGLSVSDVAAEGVDHRRELNYAVSDLMRLILHGQPIGYPWAPDLKDTVRHLLLNDLRDPATATWGPRFRHDGAVTFVPDLSLTFHVVKYLGGDVSDWPRLIDTLLAMRDLQYPQGWREGDGFLAHDLYDVATLFHLGWDRVDADRRSRMAGALGDMLAWCLAETVRPDGTVRVDAGDDSDETATYFAVGLLGELGVFDPAKRFWTRRDIPDGPALGARIAARIRDALAHGRGADAGVYYRNALARLAADGVH